MAHTKACHGTHQGPGANLGFEAWDTFQMSYNELRNTLWANGTGKKKNLCGIDSFWHAMAHPHTMTPGPGVNLGFEVWDTFQMSYNELKNTLWANGTGKKKFVRRRLVLACHGTHQGMPWHPPRPRSESLDLKLGKPSKCLIMNLETHFGQMARAKKNFVRHRLVLACHGTHQGMPWHPPRPRSEPWI
jgi:hypothetical protein